MCEDLVRAGEGLLLKSSQQAKLNVIFASNVNSWRQRRVKHFSACAWTHEWLKDEHLLSSHLSSQGGDKIRGEIEPNEKPTDIPQPVKVGAHYARKVSGETMVIKAIVPYLVHCHQQLVKICSVFCEILFFLWSAGGIVGVSDFLMVSLAKATVAVGKKVGSVVAESDVSSVCVCVCVVCVSHKVVFAHYRWWREDRSILMQKRLGKLQNLQLKVREARLVAEMC